MSDLMKTKAYKMLFHYHSNLANRLKYKAQNAVEYKSEAADLMKVLETISDPTKYDYNGILSKEEKAVIDTLEYLIDDSKPIK